MQLLVDFLGLLPTLASQIVASIIHIVVTK